MRRPCYPSSMTTAASDLDTIVSLVEQARMAATRAGSGLEHISELLGRALDDLHALQARGGRPDEGLRPDQLNSDNDR